MNFFTERRKVFLFIGILGFGMLFVFQNCSSSLLTLVNSQSASAKSKTDFSDMINASEGEIMETKNEMTAKDQSFSFADRSTIRQVTAQAETRPVLIVQPIKIKLKRAPAAKRKRSYSLKSSKHKKSKVKARSKLKKKMTSKASSKSKLKTKKKKKPYHIEG